MTPQTNCYMALDYRQAGHKNREPYSFGGVVSTKQLNLLCKRVKKLSVFKRRFWPNKRTDGQTDSKVHNFDIRVTTYMQIKIENLTVLEEQCLQNFEFTM